jgi:predicted porin
MKKSLLALAALTAFAGAASAQSSVTLFGIVDAAYAHVSAGGRSASGITNSGINSSRLGFRGVEDLGGGLRAGFWIEGQLTNDDGNAGGQTWQRRSTVSLIGNFGELRIGRDYTPNFWNTTVYDPFGTNGVGQSQTPAMLGAVRLGTGAAAPNNTAAVRSNNSIGYFLPGGLGGFTGQLMVAFGENTGGVKTNNYFGFRVGYGAGPVAVNYAYGNTKGAVGASNVKYNNVGASYDAGVVKPMFIWATEKQGSGNKVTAWQLGLTAPLGQAELRLAYSSYNVSGPVVTTPTNADDWKKLAIGYVYNLSKRTAMYGTYARNTNSGAQNRAVSNNGLSAGLSSPGGSSTGYELGVRHIF